MAEIQEFRNALLTLDSKNLTFVVEARIEEKWDTLKIPVYRDEPTIRTLPTTKRIYATVRRRFQKDSPLNAALDGTPATLTFESGGETISFSEVRAIQWAVYGKLGGEMMEEAELVVESEG